MNHSYTSYFVAIPLPEEFIQKFKILISEIKVAYPEIPTVNPTSPHFTLYYLTKESENNLDYVKKCILEQTYVLKNMRTEIGGFGFFGKDQPKVLFLDVTNTKKLK